MDSTTALDKQLGEHPIDIMWIEPSINLDRQALTSIFINLIQYPELDLILELCESRRLAVW